MDDELSQSKFLDIINDPSDIIARFKECELCKKESKPFDVVSAYWINPIKLIALKPENYFRNEISLSFSIILKCGDLFVRSDTFYTQEFREPTHDKQSVYFSGLPYFMTLNYQFKESYDTMISYYLKNKKFFSNVIDNNAVHSNFNVAPIQLGVRIIKLIDHKEKYDLYAESEEYFPKYHENRTEVIYFKENGISKYVLKLNILKHKYENNQSKLCEHKLSNRSYNELLKYKLEFV